jgi:DNA repair protein RadA/Sms
VSGLDSNRLALLIAVLGRRAGIGLATHDVYANLAGGLRVDDPALDLPLAIALASSLRDRPVRPGTVALGEVGLLGELRPVAGLERRLREAVRLGFERAIVPARGVGGPAGAESRETRADGIALVAVGTLRDALAAALVPPPAPGAEARREASAAM